jgi:CheY-specific phosphatase CheX
MYRLCSISSQLKQRVMNTIDAVISETFNNYFSVSIAPQHTNNSNFTDKNILCQVKMHQDNVVAFLYFAFDEEKLHALINSVYGDDMDHPQTVYIDAACEIANIVCCKVKALLNDNGYKFDMDIPYALNQQSCIADISDTIHMCFTINNDAALLVDLFTAPQPCHL